MKKILFIAFLFVSVFASAQSGDLQKKYKKLLPAQYENMSDGVKYIEGDMPYMYNEVILTSLDYADAIYQPQKVKYDENGKKLKEPIITGSNFKTFLSKHSRDEEWVVKSLSYFCEKFNDKNTGIVACSEDCGKSNYEFVIKVKEVYKDGRIKAHFLLKNAKTDATLFVVECVTNDGDDDDEITLRDALKSVGDLMGSALNKIQKYNAKHRQKK